MKVYTYTQARQNLATLLEQAAVEGEVWIKRQDGQVFAVRPQPQRGSPLDVPGADLGLTADEIVWYVQEGRRPAEGYDIVEQIDRASEPVYALQEDLEAAYREKAQDEAREAEALDGSEGTLGDVGPIPGDGSPSDEEKAPGNQAGR